MEKSPPGPDPLDVLAERIELVWTQQLESTREIRGMILDLLRLAEDLKARVSRLEAITKTTPARRPPGRARS
jgi:hypothetical protein